MRPLIWICIVLYTLAMAGVSFAAHRIVGNFGWFGGLVAIAAMYGAAVYWERRQEGNERGLPTGKRQVMRSRLQGAAALIVFLLLAMTFNSGSACD
jgi:hypothetical protein